MRCHERRGLRRRAWLAGKGGWLLAATWVMERGRSKERTVLPVDELEAGSRRPDTDQAPEREIQARAHSSNVGGVCEDADQAPEPIRERAVNVVVPLPRWSRLERQLRRLRQRGNLWRDIAPLFFGIFLTTVVPAVQNFAGSKTLLSWWTVVCVSSLVAAVLSFLASRGANRHESESLGCILEEMSEIRRAHERTRRANERVQISAPPRVVAGGDGPQIGKGV